MYSSELIEWSLNMTLTGKYEHALSNLTNKTSKVFEGLLSIEELIVIKQVKAIREQAIFPTCRARYQVLGRPYRAMLERTFAGTLPDVHAQL